ncbi:hypothetical protein BKA64DRAFT_646745 [Cadophora sp. MPI-SDFR-AT-0126]|nr:hypothetical protein BKA64DRAFT_646745 [Leotiomycetes sp. MPI-SDFR-AT-0126]
MASHNQGVAPPVLSFRDWTVANYEVSPAHMSDGSANEDNFDEMLERDIFGYAVYLDEIGAQAEVDNFQALCATVRGRPYQLVASTPDRFDTPIVLLFPMEGGANGNFVTSFNNYTSAMNSAHARTWTASTAHRETHIEADRRELYGLTRHWNTINSADLQDPPERSGSEHLRVAVLQHCQPQRRVLRTATATESGLTEAQSNTTTAVLSEAHQIIDQYRLDNGPQVPVERDPPLRAHEWRVLAREAEWRNFEENERYITPQGRLEDLSHTMAEIMEENDTSDEELFEENSRIRTFPPRPDFDGLYSGLAIDPVRRSVHDRNDHPMDDDESEDADEFQYDGSDDDSNSSEFCSEGDRGCDCDTY